MRAIVYDRYGSPSVLVLRDVEKPAPAEDEVLIRIRASSINSRDDRRMRANPFFIRFMVGGLFRPKTRILGADAAGTVEAIGASVKSFKVGDEVFGYLKRHQGRCFAEYALAGEEEIVLKPAKLSFEQAAAVPLAALTALQALRDKGKLQPGEKVLIQGASGGVGSFAVQIAKALGGEVTAACSERNM
ncbi:MAG: NAD(P)-dependent alcohol dehydrogenase, partial [Acidobacteria bacterium]|nr:NAD(P)-dependent alcohol dehydrogenase [Acidobacteriota bacterium]